jgi:tetratricopeptide (TPR) repeat protein
MHELVHAVAGRLVGATIYAIGLGWSGRLLRFRLAGVRVNIAWDFLFAGYCHGGFTRREATALRIAVFLGAPMLVHLACVAATLPFLSWDEFGLLEAFALWNAWFLFSVGVPRRYAGGLYSDGMALWMLLRHREEFVQEYRRGSRLLPAAYAEDPHAKRAHLERAVAEDPADGTVRGLLGHAFRDTGDHEEALRRLDDMVALEELDEDFGEAHWAVRGKLLDAAKRRVSLRGTIYLEMDRQADAIELFQTALAEETVPEARAIWQADLAMALLLDGQPERAREPAAEAFALLPWVPYVGSTHAATLLEQPQAALEGLAAADRHDPEGHYRSTHDAWRAIAHARLGQPARARRYLERAATRFPALRRLAEAAVGTDASAAPRS